MNEHTRLAIAGGIFAGTALAAIAIGWLASPAKPLAPVPQAKGWTVEQMRSPDIDARMREALQPCSVECKIPTPEQRRESQRKVDAWRRQHEETLRRLKARPLDPTGNRVAPRPRWEWKQT
jgi:hypothetical protein